MELGIRVFPLIVRVVRRSRTTVTKVWVRRRRVAVRTKWRERCRYSLYLPLRYFLWWWRYCHRHAWKAVIVTKVPTAGSVNVRISAIQGPVWVCAGAGAVANTQPSKLITFGSLLDSFVAIITKSLQGAEVVSVQDARTELHDSFELDLHAMPEGVSGKNDSKADGSRRCGVADPRHHLVAMQPSLHL